MKERSGPPGLIKAVREQAPDLLEQSSELPVLIMDAIQQVKHIKDFSEQQRSTLDMLARELRKERTTSRQTWLGLAALILAIVIAAEGAQWFLDLPVSSWLLGITGIYLLAHKR